MANKFISRSLLATAAWFSLSTPQAAATSIYDFYEQYRYDGGLPVWGLPANDTSRSFGKKIYEVVDVQSGSLLLRAVRQDGAVMAGGGEPVGLMSAGGNGGSAPDAPETGVGAGTTSGEGSEEGAQDNLGGGGELASGNTSGSGSQSEGAGGGANLSGLPTLDGIVADLGMSGEGGEGAGSNGPVFEQLYTSSSFPVFLWGGVAATTGMGMNSSSGEPASESNGEEAGRSIGGGAEGNGSETALTAFSICSGSECEEMLSDPSATLAFEAACVDNLGCMVVENEPAGEPGTVPPVRPVLLDELTVVAASDVPEPETYALFAAGLALIAVRRLRAS